LDTFPEDTDGDFNGTTFIKIPLALKEKSHEEFIHKKMKRRITLF